MLSSGVGSGSSYEGAAFTVQTGTGLAACPALLHHTLAAPMLRQYLTRACLLHLPSPADIDATGIHFLDDLVDELRDDNVDLVLGNPAKNVLVQLKRAHLVRKIGRANIHINVADAVNQVGGSYCNWAGQGYGCMGA